LLFLENQEKPFFLFTAFSGESRPLKGFFNGLLGPEPFIPGL